MTAINLDKKERDLITKALEIAMDVAYQKVDHAGKNVLLKASFAWRTNQPDYNPLSDFVKECDKWGCD